MSTPNEPTRLPFDIPRQSATLWYLITDPVFFSFAKTRILPAWFDSGLDAQVYKALLAFHERTGSVPKSGEELKHSQEIDSEVEVAHRRSLHAAIENARVKSDLYSLSAIRLEITEWMKAFLYRSSVDQSIGLYNLKKYDECYGLVSERIRQVQDARFEGVSKFDWDDSLNIISAIHKTYEGACTTGHALLDDALLPRSRRGKGTGGLLRGQTTVALAPTSVGKTTFLVTVIRANLKKMRHILWLIHEGQEVDLLLKLLCCVLGKNDVDVENLAKSEAGRQTLQTATTALKKYVHFCACAGKSINEVEAYIRTLVAERKADGLPAFDLLIDDYPAILSAGEAARGGADASRRDQDDYVYRRFMALGREFGWATVLAVQANREGSKASRKGDGVEMEHIAESFSVGMAADNVVALSRRREDTKRIVFSTKKCRYAEVGCHVVAKANLEHSTTHSEALGAVACWDREDAEWVADNYFDTFKNKALPDMDVRKLRNGHVSEVANGPMTPGRGKAA